MKLLNSFFVKHLNQLKVNNSDNHVLRNFFWLISGSEISILKECENDYNRHATMGFLLFMTWVVATAAGGITGWYFGYYSPGEQSNHVSKITEDYRIWSCIGFGVLWGLLIYAIDRGMVVSLKKNPTLSKQPFWIPFTIRFLLGLMIAFFISIPVELIIFKNVINLQIEKEYSDGRLEKKKKSEDLYDISKQYTALLSKKTELDDVKNKIGTPCKTPAIPDLKMRNTILSIKPAINFIAYRFPLPPKKWLFGKINRDIKMKYN